MLIVFGLLLVGIVGIYLWKSYTKNMNDLNNDGRPGQTLKNISPKEAHTLLQEHQGESDFVILDVRTANEFKQARLQDAINLDFYSRTFRNGLQDLQKDKIYLVYCRSGNRSAQALYVMKGLNFTHAYNMSGGITSWSQQKLPLVQ